jgi:hypothetical protein
MLVKPFHRPGWVYEEKIDGWRLGAYKVGSNVRLVSGPHDSIATHRHRNWVRQGDLGWVPA